MEKVTLKSKIAEVFQMPELRGLKKFLIYSNEPMPEETEAMRELTFDFFDSTGWSAEMIVNGLNFLLEELRANRLKQYFIYDRPECNDAFHKEDVNLIQLLPEHIDKKKPFILLAAGGSYSSVCTMVESLPTARHLTEAGYQVFLLTYRVGGKGAVLRAMDDLIAALRYIEQYKEELGIDPEKYVLGGFSAGANLISGFGVPDIGYRLHRLPKPAAMLVVYPLIDLKAEAARDEKGGLLIPMFGPDYKNLIAKYDIAQHVDHDYPPCYIVCGKDDNAVSPKNSELLKELLDQADVPAILEEAESARHSFGDGTGTDAEGWPQRAVHFLESL